MQAWWMVKAPVKQAHELGVYQGSHSPEKLGETCIIIIIIIMMIILTLKKRHSVSSILYWKVFVEIKSKDCAFCKHSNQIKSS